MVTEQLKVLSINPGSRYLGFAVFYDDDLIDWGITVVQRGHRRASQDRGTSVLGALFGMYKIDRLVLKSLHPSRSSLKLRTLVGSIKTLARRKGIAVREYTLDGIKRNLIDAGRRNKLNLMKSVVARYGFLASNLDRATAEKRPYQVRMFEAVAGGLNYLLQQLKGGKGRHHAFDL